VKYVGLRFFRKCVKTQAVRVSDHTLNRLSIVKAILEHSPVARSDLPSLTNLSAGLITQLTQTLVKSDLVTETKDENSRKGRPRLLLELNEAGAVVVGASIDGRGNLLTTFVSLAGRKLFETSGHFPIPESLPDMAQHIGHTLNAAITESGFPRDRIARIGIALPALINSQRGEVHFGSTFAAEPTPFAAPISQIVGIPVTIENELDCMARAEHWFGNARGIDDFTLIRVGFSIDAAQFASGVPWSGKSGFNSSFGHVKVAASEGGNPCYCGGIGCLTAYVSMYGILNSLGLLADLPFPPMEQIPERFAKFIDDAQFGRAGATLAFQKAANLFGVAIGNLLNTTNPLHLFIAVDDQKYLELLEPSCMAALGDTVMTGVLPFTRIKFFQSNGDWRWKGTAALALEQLYLDDSRNGVSVHLRRKMKAVNDQNRDGTVKSVAV
jgi:predicted NBD/HSP70 family sugar kinase